MRLLIDTEIVNLHPEVHLLGAVKHRRFAVGGRDPRPHFGCANHEHAGTNILRRYGLNGIGQNQRRIGQLLVREVWHNDAPAPSTHAIAVYILYYHIQPITSGAKWYSFPINLR